MIETEEQRRWWFATHPEYSWSRTGQRSRKHTEEDEEPEKLSPEDVDAYVDDALKHATGTVADFLGIIKKWFGTKEQSQGSRPESDTSGWDTEAGGRTARGGSRGGSRRGRPEEIRDWFIIRPHHRQQMEVIESELGRAGVNRRDYRFTNFQGQSVAQRDSTFDPKQRDEEGRTNVERMQQGLAPYDRNGDRVVIHHAGQQRGGPLVELTASEHAAIPVSQNPSQINRREADAFRASYWRARAESFVTR